MGSLVPSYLLMATTATWAYLLSGGSTQNLRRFLLCKSCSVMGTGNPAGSSGYLDQRWGGERVPQGIIPLAARLEETLRFGAMVRLLPLLGEVDGVMSLVKTAPPSLLLPAGLRSGANPQLES